MRTNIVIDDKLIAEAQRLTGIATKRGVVEEALQLLVRLKRQEAVKAWRGFNDQSFLLAAQAG